MDLGSDSDDENIESFDENIAENSSGDDSDSVDDDDPLNGVKGFKAMERKSKKLDLMRQKDIEEAEQDMKEQADQARVKEDDDDSFYFPTPAILDKEKELGVDMSIIKTRIEDNLRILNNFKQERDGIHSRKEYIALLVNDLSFYFEYNQFLVEKLLTIFPPHECYEFMAANEQHRPLTLRTNTLKTRRGDLAKTLIGRGVNLDPVPWSKVALQVFESTVPVGATPEYLAGHYMLQSVSSMTAVMALDPQPDERILDMCAAPGGKTTYIAQLMKNTGMVFANDVNPERLSSVTANIHRLGVRNTVIINYDGREFPKVIGGFDRVLLDAPCTGTGIISRDASVKVTKSEEDLVKLSTLQKELILAAIDSVDATTKNPIIVYSTCSITVEENEDVVNYALKKRNVKLLDTGLEFGKEGFTSYKGKKYHPSIKLTKRYYPHVYNMDGFYVAKLIKLSNKVDNKSDQKDEAQKTANDKKRKRGDKNTSDKKTEEYEFVELEIPIEEEAPKKSKKTNK